MAGITYDETKTAMEAANYPVSPESGWHGKDAGSYRPFAGGACYKGGVYFGQRAEYNANYGFAYPGMMPGPVTAAVVGGSYSGVLAGSPLTGEAGITSVTFTLTETGGAGSSFSWDFGDGNTATTTTPTTTHTYAAAGSYTAKVTPTVDGVVTPQISATAPIVVSAAYSATLAGSPLTGTAGTTSITWSLTESNVPAGATKSYLWDFGDSQTTTTATPSAPHTYAAAGSYTAKVTPTINGVVRAQITAAAPAVIS